MRRRSRPRIWRSRSAWWTSASPPATALAGGDEGLLDRAGRQLGRPVAAGLERVGDRFEVGHDALAGHLHERRVVRLEVGGHLGAHTFEHQLDELWSRLLHPRRDFA
jgi:hypothetical protein